MVLGHRQHLLQMMKCKFRVLEPVEACLCALLLTWVKRAKLTYPYPTDHSQRNMQTCHEECVGTK